MSVNWEFVSTMGTIIKRTRKDGTVTYTARVKLTRGGKLLFSLAQTFEKEKLAKAWMAKKEKEIYAPDFMSTQKATVVTLS